MKAEQLAQKVQRYFYEKGNLLQICGYSGSGWWNPDILVITKARLAIDVEIKVSRSDFKREFIKQSKHNYLREKRAKQSYFYFAVPRDLVSLEEVPNYAGLIYVDEKGISIIRKAPLLSRQKVSDEDIISVANSLSAKCIFGESYMNMRRNEKQVEYTHPTEDLIKKMFFIHIKE